MSRCLFLLTLGLSLFLPHVSSGSPLILSEFMAKNETGLQDEDGAFPDWIEIHNPGTNTVSLLNWSLTDSRSRPDKWVFPSTNISAGGFLIVFASEKDRRTPGAPLHTNFKLSDDGEYLALIEPNRTTLATAFAPKFPQQFQDVSYGLGMEITPVPLVTNGSPASVQVPSSGEDGLLWTRLGFNDGAWSRGPQPVGFDVGTDPVEDTYVGALLSSQPLLYYRFGETNGLGVTNLGSLGAAGDALRVGAVGTNQTGPQGVSFGGFETNNRAYRFGGSARVRIPDLPELNLGDGPFAVSFWFLPTTADVAGDLFTYKGTGGHFSIQYATQAPGTVSVFHNGAIGGTGGATSGVWHHCVVTRDGAGQLQMYLNGIQTFDVTDTGSMDIDNDLLIGSNHNGDPSVAQRAFGGRMDEFALWNRHLEEATVVEFNQVARSRPPVFTPFIRTDLQAAMSGRASSAYVRIPFVVGDPAAVDRLMLRLRYDDGVVAFINGREVASLNAPIPALWDSLAAGRHSDREAVVAAEINITDLRDALVAGTNILALHGMNASASNPDFLLGAELEATQLGRLGVVPRYFVKSSPGEPNGAGIADIGPILGGLSHSPAVPKASENVFVTARVSPSFSPITTVTLKYRVNYGVTNSLLMADDGLHGDGASGDGVFGAIIPPATATNGQCLRFRVEAADVSGRASRWPLFEDPVGSPEYQGTMVQDAPLNTPLPVWHWWARTPDKARTREGERVSVFFNGEFFDNVYARERGGATTLGSQKFDFNRGYTPRMSDEVGRVEEVNLNSNGSDATFARPLLAFDTYRRAGNAACAAFPVLMRLNGRADRVANYIEQVDTRFVNRFGYNDNGVLYKMVQRSSITPVFSDSTDGVEKKTFTSEPNSDLQQIVAALKLPTVAQRQAFFFDHLNIAEFVNFLACRSLIMDADDVRKNFYMYLDREGTGEWLIFPWDKDWTFGVLGDGGDALPHPFFGEPAYSKPDTQANVLWQYFFTDPLPREMYLRRLRSVIDAQLQPPWTPIPFLTFESRVDDWIATLLKDQPSVAGGVAELKGFFPRRRQELYVTYNVLGTTNAARGLVPDAQPARVNILFGDIETNPSSGNQGEEYIQLVNTNSFAVDISGWRVSGGIRHTFIGGTVIPALQSLYLSPDVVAFRARPSAPRGGMGLFIQGNYDGQLSARSEELVLTDAVGRLIATTSTPNEPSPAQQSLGIAEFMFHPAPPPPGSPYPPEAFQFIELWNHGTGSVDLAGVKFVDGIGFEFPRNISRMLPPQGRVVLVQNRDAFVSRYGAGIEIAGVFSGRMAFDGEKLRLEDANGEEIQEFAYDPAWHLLADGEGFSLTATEVWADYSDRWNTAWYWNAGSVLNGTPGRSDPDRVPGFVFVEEVVSRPLPGQGDSIELYNRDTLVTADISGWFLSDDPHTPKKYRFPSGSTIPPRGSLVIRESAFAGPSALIPFTLRNTGDEAFLYSADASGNLTGYAHGLRFGATEPGGSSRRWVAGGPGDGFEWVFSSPVSTLGVLPKTPPIMTTAVISEIHYHPVDLPGGVDNTLDEFIELRNLTSQNLPLFDPSDPTTPWGIRGDVDFDFPPGTVLLPGAALVLVSFDPRNDPAAAAGFWARAGTAPTARLVGPFRGKLSNSGGHLQLIKRTKIRDALDPDFGAVAEILVDEVAFRVEQFWNDDSHAHWRPPLLALTDGQGASLHRDRLEQFGPDPRNWIAASPTPGRQALNGTPPRVIQHPESRQGLLGSPLTLSVVAEGTGPLRYQWQFERQAIPSATNETLSLSNPTPDQEGQYQVLIMNGFGITYSGAASVAFAVPPIITSMPSNQVALLGGRAAFRVSAFGRGAVSYQWQRNGIDIPGATTTNLSLTAITAADFGVYTVSVTDRNASIRSQPATLTLSTPPVAVVSPQSLSAVLGESIVFSVVVDGPPPFTYRWRRGTTSLLTTTLNSGMGFLSLTNVRAIDGGTNYSVVVTNLAGSVSNAFSLTLVADVDKDGVADSWETRFGLNPGDAGDAVLDADQDGRSNREEYLSGTSPVDGGEVLMLEVSGISFRGTPMLRFRRQALKTYSVQVRTALGTGGWTKFEDVPAAAEASDHLFEADPGAQESALYRIVTPRQP